MNYTVGATQIPLTVFSVFDMLIPILLYFGLKCSRQRMPSTAPTNWSLFRILCRVMGGQDVRVLGDSFARGLLPHLIDMAQRCDVLPSLAMRCEQQLADRLPPGTVESEQLVVALRNNTMRNMQISAQALKLAKQLNKAGITPLFLKGTVQLLTANTKTLGFRKQVDIDLVVEPGQIQAAADVFLADGYGFCDFSSNATAPPPLTHDTATAIKRSGAHHHLTPLVKSGYATTVELHRHFLPKRFQSSNPLEPLFNTANQHERHGAKFRVPSTEYQMIHLILGKLVNDNYLARRTMPLRESCDYIQLMEDSEGRINEGLVRKHCGKNFSLFAALVTELMAYTPGTANNGHQYKNIGKRVRMMAKRYNSSTMGAVLDAYARTLYLSHKLAHEPAKLPAYLNRLGRS